MRLIELLVVIIYMATCGAQECPTASFPNVRYLGMGYNILKGNPDNNLHDPGFTFPVLKFTSTGNSRTSDNKYQIPDHIQALQTKSCSYQSKALSEFGAQSYQNSLSVDVSVEGSGSYGLWSARFSASVGYKEVNEGTSQQRRVYVSARGKCLAYELAVNYATAPIAVTDNFLHDVKALPLQADQNAFNAFFNQYGTHFTSRTKMGAKMVVRSEFTEDAYSKMRMTSLNIAAAAQASYSIMASGSVSAETQTQRERREAFESKRSSFSASYLGTHPPSDGKWETWAKSTAESSFPVAYTLVPITFLLQEKFITGMSASELTTRRTLLEKAYATYCSGIAACQTPGPDRIPMLTAAISTRIHGTSKVSCNAGYKLLSCGMTNVKAEGGSDITRHAVPVSSTECECKDNEGAICRNWCTNVNLNFVIRTSGVGATANAYCPEGYKVCRLHTLIDLKRTCLYTGIVNV